MKTNTKTIRQYILMLALLCAGAVSTAQAATYTVTNANDSGAGSLRDAINQANASAADDTIVFAPEANGTIILASALPNLANNGTLTINGNGAGDTIISGNNAVCVFEVAGGANVALNKLTVTRGFTSSANNGGGGIRINGGATVAIADSIISNNITANANGGGGIINYGALTVIRSTISSNSATNARGGGVRSIGTLTISDSLINDNTANGTSAVASEDSTAILTNTTISGNGLTRAAEAILNVSINQAAHLTLNNCTVTGNNGSGIRAVRNSTGSSETTTLKNSIIANNSTPQLAGGGANTPYISQGYNLTSDNGSGLLTATGDQINTDPMLGLLADNGGPTLTHALLCGSPAIDGGWNSNGLTNDQRGAGFARTVDLGAANAGDGTDIGAFEAQIEPDCTAPVITANVSGTSGNNGWFTSNVVVSWSVSDDESTVSGQTGCDLQTVTADTNGVTFTCSATSAGGSNSQSVTIKRDAAAPTLAPTVTPNPVLSGGTATAAANAADAMSGIASQSCAAVDTATVGTKSLTCTATDLAGNTNTANVSYQVNSRFNFTGFFQPVDNLPTVNVVTAGQAVPLKFSLGGYQGLSIFAPGYPASSQVACSATEPGSTIEETVNAGGSTLSYDAVSDRYSYVWKTNKAWKDTCRIFVLKLNDGSEHYAKFRFR